MSRIVEIVAMALGGLSLFTVCFVGFAALAGVPMHEVAVVGGLFPEPEPPSEDGAPAPAGPRPDAAAAVPVDPVAASRGVLAAWRLEPPFGHDELKELADALVLKRGELERRAAELDEREEALALREGSVDEQLRALEELRGTLEREREALELRAAEVAAAEDAADRRADRRFAELAKLFADLDPAEASARIVGYPPDEATRILRALEEDLARLILNGLQGEAYLEYAEAYADAAPAG